MVTLNSSRINCLYSPLRWELWLLCWQCNAPKPARCLSVTALYPQDLPNNRTARDNMNERVSWVTEGLYCVSCSPLLWSMYFHVITCVSLECMLQSFRCYHVGYVYVNRKSWCSSLYPSLTFSNHQIKATGFHLHLFFCDHLKEISNFMFTHTLYNNVWVDSKLLVQRRSHGL